MPRGYRKEGGFTQELKDTVKEYYLSSPQKLELAALSVNSTSLFGQFIPEETLKDWKRYDADGDWEHTWTILHPGSTDEEMDNIIRRIYEVAMNPRTPAAVVASAAKAYIDAREKYNPQKGSTAKTSPDRVKQIIKEVQKEMKDGLLE